MEHRVEPQEAGLCLREILRRVMGVSYTAMKSAKWEDRILLNGVPTPVDRRVEAGDAVTLLPKDEKPAYPLLPYELPLDIPYQDAWLMVIDKPAPLASQSSLGHPNDSLENALYAHLGCPTGFIYRPVNRLDKGTSGLMTVALDAHTQHRCQRLLHTQDFVRIYLAVVEGHPAQPRGVIDLPIDKVDEASVRRIVTPQGKPSITRYEVLAQGRTRSLVRLQLETGRTHQIRVHMQAIGHPVAGDFLYGGELPQLPGRFALHSAEIHLTHPMTGEKLHILSPMPDAFSALLD